MSHEMGVQVSCCLDTQISSQGFVQATPKVSGKIVSQFGRAAVKERNFPEAVKHLQKARTIDPSNYRSYLNLAFAYREVGKISEAQEMLNKAVRLNPDIWRMKPSS